MLADATVVPVITAHPTETRRRTIFDAQNRITELMRLRGRTELTPAEEAATLAAIRRQILTMAWQTALIRIDRPTIVDDDPRRVALLRRDLLRRRAAHQQRDAGRTVPPYPEAGLEDAPLIRMGRSDPRWRTGSSPAKSSESPPRRLRDHLRPPSRSA